MAEQPTSSSTVGNGRTRFYHDASKVEIKEDGYMSYENAQRVMVEALEEWGVDGRSDNIISAYAGAIAQTLRKGTSAERKYQHVSFAFRGREYPMDVLALAASRYDASENPVRVFARSYKSGEIAVRVHDMLANPENTQLREQACLDYLCTMDVVHVSFDFADALVKFQDFRLSQLERYVIKRNTAEKSRASRSAFIGGTEGGSIQDGATHAAKVDAGNTSTQTPGFAGAGSAKNRANFAAMR